MRVENGRDDGCGTGAAGKYVTHVVAEGLNLIRGESDGIMQHVVVSGSKEGYEYYKCHETKDHVLASSLNSRV